MKRKQYMLINLNMVEKIKTFVGIVSKYEEKITAMKEGYSLNAKSIFGLLSLDLSTPVKLVFTVTDEKAFAGIIEELTRSQFEYELCTE